MYEPKIRCADAYREYIDRLYKATKLDRNQIVRLAMFCAPFSGLFQSKIEGRHLKDGQTLPPASWNQKQDGIWLTQSGEFTPTAPEDEIIVRSGSAIGGRSI